MLNTKNHNLLCIVFFHTFLVIFNIFQELKWVYLCITFKRKCYKIVTEKDKNDTAFLFGVVKQT